VVEFGRAGSPAEEQSVRSTGGAVNVRSIALEWQVTSKPSGRFTP